MAEDWVADAGKSCGFEANMTVFLAVISRNVVVVGGPRCCCEAVDDFNFESPSLMTRSGGRKDPGSVGNLS